MTIRTIFQRGSCAVLMAAIGLLAVTSPANATGRWHTSTLKAVYPLADGQYVFAFTTDAPDCPSKAHYITVGQNGVSDEGAKRIYAAALVAFATGTSVQMFYDDATVYCYANRIYVGS